MTGGVADYRADTGAVQREIQSTILPVSLVNSSSVARTKLANMQEI